MLDFLTWNNMHGFLTFCACFIGSALGYYITIGRKRIKRFNIYLENYKGYRQLSIQMAIDMAADEHTKSIAVVSITDALTNKVVNITLEPMQLMESLDDLATAIQQDPYMDEIQKKEYLKAIEFGDIKI